MSFWTLVVAGIWVDFSPLNTYEVTRSTFDNCSVDSTSRTTRAWVEFICILVHVANISTKVYKGIRHVLVKNYNNTVIVTMTSAHTIDRTCLFHKMLSISSFFVHSFTLLIRSSTKSKSCLACWHSCLTSPWQAETSCSAMAIGVPSFSFILSIPVLVDASKKLYKYFSSS